MYVRKMYYHVHSRLSIGDKFTWVELEGTSKAVTFRGLVLVSILHVILSYSRRRSIDVRLIIVTFVSQKVPLYYLLG